MNSNATYKFILSGGGTGGHIYPAIAIANALKARYPKAEFLFVGALGRMEMQKVPQAGYNIKGLWISGINRSITLKNLLFPLKLICSLWRSFFILNSFKPNVVIGTGGFASGPLLFVSSLKGIPCLIQEQNSYPGITNKLLAKRVQSICVAFQGLESFFPAEKIKITGNPVRQDLLDVSSLKEVAIDNFKLNKSKTTLLVLGGSLGAKRINQLIASHIADFDQLNVQVIWQCGALYKNTYQVYDNENHIQVHPFLNNMDQAYAAADIIISRAGAISVSELCIVGKPVIFVPSPNVAEDHQSKNAKAVVNKNAAIMITENDLEQTFLNTFSSLIKDEAQQNALKQNIKLLAMPKATENILNQIELLLNK